MQVAAELGRSAGLAPATTAGPTQAASLPSSVVSRGLFNEKFQGLRCVAQ